jgi:hypothetical protein
VSKIKQQITTSLRQVTVIERSPKDGRKLLPRVFQLLAGLIGRPSAPDCYDCYTTEEAT